MGPQEIEPSDIDSPGTRRAYTSGIDQMWVR
jgi:hypothetical protein